MIARALAWWREQRTPLVVVSYGAPYSPTVQRVAVDLRSLQQKLEDQARLDAALGLMPGGRR